MLRDPSGGVLAPIDDLWETTSFPVMEEVTFARMGKKGDEMEVEYRSGTKAFKIRFPLSARPEGLAKFILPGTVNSPAAVEYLANVYRKVGAKVFAGPLASVPEQKRLALIQLAHIETKGVGVRPVTYKDNPYLAVDLKEDGNVYNTLRLNQSQRVTHVVTERSLLTLLKAFAAPLKDVSGMGIAMRTIISSKDFTETYALAKDEELTIYAPPEAIRQFAAADITNQQFIDACIVILDNNRIQVNLTGGSGF